MIRHYTIALALMATVAANATTVIVEEQEMSDSSRVHDLDEVVIVQQSKEFLPLRQQPISSTVMTSLEMSSLGTRDIRELSSFIPSFVMPIYGSSYTPTVYVRGIGSRINSPSVGFYVDGIPLISKSAFSTHFYEMDRVDVLRGPQGTLYGMNTEGGLVRMYSKNPMNYQGTDLRLGGGSHFYRTVEAAHYAKESDKFAWSWAAFYDGQNGFFKNTFLNVNADRYDEAGTKLRFIYKPTQRLSFDWITDFQYTNQNAYPYGVQDLETGTVADPSQNIQSHYERNILNSGLNIHYIGRGFDFNSNTSYQFLYDHMLMDNDYTELDFVSLSMHQRQHSITQEFTFKGNQVSRWHWTTGVFGSYQWLRTVAPTTFGSYFKTIMKMNAVEKMIYGQVFQSMAARMGEQGAAAAIERAGGIHIGVDMQVPGDFQTPQLNLGVFHESTFDITDNLMAVIGLRYDYNHSEIDYKTNGNMDILFSILGANVRAQAISEFSRHEKSNFSQLLPKFGLTYKLGNGSNIYATVAKGYRAGGYNFQMFADIIQSDINTLKDNLQAQMMTIMSERKDITMRVEHTDADYENLLNTISFKPEESWNYELGTHLNLFNNSVHLDLSAFYMQILNQQLSVLSSEFGYGRVMVNAGKSYSCGVEASLHGMLFDNHLSYMLNYGFTHANFKEYETGEGDSYVSYKGKTVPFVPQHTISAMADYRFSLSNPVLQAIVLGANVSAMGKIYWDEANEYSQKLYAVLGAHADADFGRVKLSLWGRNLTNSKYNTFAFLSKATGQPVFSAQRGNPFQFGADVKIHF